MPNGRDRRWSAKPPISKLTTATFLNDTMTYLTMEARMALDPMPLQRTSKVLPNYAHPPLIAVRMGIRCRDGVAMDVAEFAQQLGPSWVKSAPASLRVPQEQAGSADEAPQATFAGVLGDQYLEVFAKGIDFLWDGRSGESYPHYETLRDAFLTAFDAWSQSSGSAALPLRWQISYWNRVPQGTVWQELDDLSFCRLLTSAGETPFTESLVGFHQSWTFRATDSSRRLRCEAWLEKKASESELDAIWIALTSSGPIEASQAESGDSGSDWLSDLDAGRRSIVSGFRGLMSLSANAYWGLND